MLCILQRLDIEIWRARIAIKPHAIGFYIAELQTLITGSLFAMKSHPTRTAWSLARVAPT